MKCQMVVVASLLALGAGAGDSAPIVKVGLYKNGLAGIGDLIVTCTSVHSRNHSVGERLGKGEKIEDILGSMQMVAEGVWNSKVVHEIAKKLGVEMPICEMVYAICYKGLSVADAAKKVMERRLKAE